MHRVAFVAQGIVALVALAACDEASKLSCGTAGRAVTASDGARFCVYRVDRSCPGDFPFALDLGDVLVCAEDTVARADLPPEVCNEIGSALCMEPPMDGSVDRDMGELDAGVEPDADVEDALAPDGGPLPCGLDPSIDPVLPRTGALGTHFALASSEASGAGYVHVGILEHGHAIVVTRRVTDFYTPLVPPEVDLTEQWGLTNARSLSLTRDDTDGSVYVIVLHDGAADFSRERATIGRIAAGSTLVEREGGFDATTGPAGDAEVFLGRPAMVGGGEEVPRRFVWRVDGMRGVVLGALGPTFERTSYSTESREVTMDALSDLRGTSRRIVLVPDADRALLWDAVEPPAELDVLPMRGRTGRAAFVYVGPAATAGVTGHDYLLAFPTESHFEIDRVRCTPACEIAESDSIGPMTVGPFDHTTLDVVPGGYVLGATSGGNPPMFIRLDGALSAVPGSLYFFPLAPSSRRVVDVQTTLVRDGADLHAIVGVLMGGPGATEGDALHVSGVRYNERLCD